ncbi:lysine--tRNA ligase [Thalassospira marina]|uniref:Lysine--tRNA ligase n=1 Tax=Thalassospira marina TaxID=2048283 RepID=A0A2N3KZM7_9PROT|nr:lysine--tRNA ligase [Thalassospira marina]AUG52101.1 lysine--tRNA ligase [Thalassospira marina]PKR56025.1 lysine--tRNA ligase [Thalassospira marina]
MTADLRDAALNSNVWAFAEAQKLVQRYKDKKPEKGYVLFETGYGPSGLPHIGTFGEVARTTYVRRAFETMSDIPTKLFCFSDDMDGLRKVPDNIPNREMVAQHLGKALTSVPDPFGKFESFAHHNNARLREFLDSFGFEYEFKSSTECYRSGMFDAALLRVLEVYDNIQKIMLPTLGEERRATYSPFMPVEQDTQKVLMAKIVEIKASEGIIVYEHPETGKLVETPVTGGHCKLQWKPDWAMRWYALGVDYEMAGKDLIPSVDLGNKIVKAMGGTPPEGFNYELFLDENGQKISKSKGNGLSVEEWLTYAPEDSLSLFMFQKPKAAKRLYFDVIPKTVDEYLTFADKLKTETDPVKLLQNPAWHIHAGSAPDRNIPISFGILLNLVSVCNTDDKGVLWGFISRYAEGATPENAPYLDKLVGYAINYYRDFVKPTKKYREASEAERAALVELREVLVGLDKSTNGSDIQNAVYEIGKNHECFADLRAWFKALYEILLGQEQGPRMGSFIALYGIDESVALIDRALAGEDLGA